MRVQRSGSRRAQKEKAGLCGRETGGFSCRADRLVTLFFLPFDTGILGGGCNGHRRCSDHTKSIIVGKLVVGFHNPKIGHLKLSFRILILS